MTNTETLLFVLLGIVIAQAIFIYHIWNYIQNNFRMINKNFANCKSSMVTDSDFLKYKMEVAEKYTLYSDFIKLREFVRGPKGTDGPQGDL